MAGRGAGPTPPRWLGCPRKSDTLIGNRFLALKTPLDDRFNDQVEPQDRFSPAMLFQSMKVHKVKVGLWIDLTNTGRFYNKRQVEDQGCKYLKLPCKGRGESPGEEACKTFIGICKSFIAQNPMDIVAVHCTHGFNRTGFLISCFLIEEHDWSVDAAVQAFRAARQPGIYKADYLKDIYVRYGEDAEDAPPAPDLPEWCFEDGGVDDDGEPLAGPGNGESNGGSHGGGGGGKRARPGSGKFMAGVPGVAHYTLQPKLATIQKKVQRAVGWTKGGFPGAQPVSMDRRNINFLTEKPYKVSWKADGTRYMMLVDGEDEVYFIDRDNCVYQVSGLTFLHRKHQDRHIQDTVMDGEMVIDTVDGVSYPRFLIYDIIRYEGNEVGKCDFGTRLLCIEKEIVGARNNYITQGVINKTREPFSIRKKDFWDIGDTYKLLRPEFTANLAHEPDGLIFQPAGNSPINEYKGGRDDEILKWKPASMNSVDFKLQIVREEGPGLLPKNIGKLFVGQSKDFSGPFSQIKLTKELKELSGKIIECKWADNQWMFMRERTDKAFPNGYNTAIGVIESIKNPVTEDYLTSLITHQRYRRPQDSGGGMLPPQAKRPRH